MFAPTARIVGARPTLITIDLALVLELPSPVRLVALGRLRALLPDEHDPVVRLQVDLLGVIDFDRAEAAVDATLVDSRLAQFALTGDMALRMSWGAAPDVPAGRRRLPSALRRAAGLPGAGPRRGRAGERATTRSCGWRPTSR